MIRIVKSRNIPAVLKGNGRTETAKNTALFDANPASFNSGKSNLEISSAIYGAREVKEQLIAEQFGKCCYCEADFTANGYGDVEHFRPKAGYKQARAEKGLIRPGYYWLAYEWTNLLFSCQVCNQRYKKNYFPLVDNGKRAKNHHHAITREKPLLIHPAKINPEKHIRFRKHVPSGIDDFGNESIYGYGINRPKLNEARERYLNNVRNNVMLARLDLDALSQEDKDRYSRDFSLAWADLEDLILKAKEFVKIAAQPQSPYAAMVRANFPKLPTS
jgi:uncharacterized protein (TIGR02646 family)